MNTGLPSFERMVEMAKRNPEELEALRQREVESLISQAPAHLQRRLRGLQFQIDSKRQLHRTPLGSCMAMSQMMLRALDELNDALQGTHPRNSNSLGAPSPSAAQAKVIRFPALAR